MRQITTTGAAPAPPPEEKHALVDKVQKRGIIHLCLNLDILKKLKAASKKKRLSVLNNKMLKMESEVEKGIDQGGKTARVNKNNGLKNQQTTHPKNARYALTPL